jgi:hypothetical protein
MTSKIRSYRTTILIVLGLAAFGILSAEWVVVIVGMIVSLVASWLIHDPTSSLMSVSRSLSEPVLDDPDAARRAHLGLEAAEISPSTPSERLLTREPGQDKPIAPFERRPRWRSPIRIHPALFHLATLGIGIFCIAHWWRGLGVGDSLFLGLVFALGSVIWGEWG